MKPFFEPDQIASGSRENFLKIILSNSTRPQFVYHPKKSDSLSQAELYSHYQNNKKDMALLAVRMDSCEKRLALLERNTVVKLEIKTLKRYELKQPLEAILESDDGGFIARTVDLPLFGYGEDTIEAVENLKHEVESLYFDLMEDDNFSEEWIKTKKFLKTIFKKK
jgi:hypothetical protein